MPTAVPSTAPLVQALGDVARAGRTGRLLFSSERGPLGGFLSFAGGFLRSVAPPEGSTWKMPGRRDREGVLAEVRNLCRAAAGAARFQDTESKAPAPGSGLTAAEIAISLASTITEEEWLSWTLVEGPPRRLALPDRPPASPPPASALRGPVETFLVLRAAASPASNVLDQVLAASPGSSLTTLQSLFALTSCGVVALPECDPEIVAAGRQAASARPLTPPATAPRPEAAPPTRAVRREIVERVRPAQGAPETAEREEILQRCRAVEGLDYYAILEVGQRASEAEIRTAYYRLARRYHPDKVRKPHLEDLLPQAEKMFAAVTEAYNTLTQASARAEYDRTLIEIAAGRKTPDQREQQAHARDLFLRGRRSLEAKHLFEALGYLEAAVKADPTRAEYFHYLGACQAHNPKWRKKAEENLLKAVEMNPGALESYRELARLYRRGGLASRSHDMYRKVLQWDPEDKEALEALEESRPGGGFLGSLFSRS